MRLLAFSDLHRDATAARAIVAASAGADVVIAAGDFATKREGLADTLDILRALTAPTIIVSGNHDRLDDLRGACAGWPHGNVLHGEGVELAGMRFFGLGFEIGGNNDAPWNSRMSEVEAAAALASCPDGAILVTHMPPFGVADLQKSGSHDGSHAIRATVELKQPRIHLCGHIHYAWGSSGTIGPCPVYNLGPRLNWFTI
jgi:uncharacterized protein